VTATGRFAPIETLLAIASFSWIPIVVIAPDGRHFGHPERMAALEREPYELRTSDYRCHGEGVAERVLRALGWLALVAFVVFGRRRFADLGA
jgi:hypothetical protein